jgi:hypothetical protein
MRRILYPALGLAGLTAGFITSYLRQQYQGWWTQPPPHFRPYGRIGRGHPTNGGDYGRKAA